MTGHAYDFIHQQANQEKKLASEGRATDCASRNIPKTRSQVNQPTARKEKKTSLVARAPVCSLLIGMSSSEKRKGSSLVEQGGQLGHSQPHVA